MIAKYEMIYRESVSTAVFSLFGPAGSRYIQG